MSVTHPTPADLGITWRDRKRYLFIISGLMPLLIFVAWGLVELTGWEVFWFIGPIVFHVLMPLADTFVRKDPENPPPELVGWLENDRYYRAIIYTMIPLQYVVTFLAAWIVTQQDISWIGYLGLSWSVGYLTALAINAAHELGHKKETVNRWIARIALAPCCYGHFYVEHNRGHHVRVATPEDPASSRLGESFWTFLPRTAFGGIRSAWNLEATRLRRRGDRVLSVHNDVLNAWAMSVVLWGAMIALFGPALIPFIVISAGVSILLFESVNYLEHYGLLRQKTESGRYERCAPRHSWNSCAMPSNLMLLQLQRHSDHHANPTREYQALQHMEDAPQLPSGYGTMITLAVIPPLWRRVMDKRVFDFYGNDPSLMNIHPPKREQVLARIAKHQAKARATGPGTTTGS